MSAFYSSNNRIEIYHLRNLLESAGIACRLRNEALSQLAGELPFPDCAMEIWLLNDDDRERADALLALMRNGPPSDQRGGAGWQCTCGEALDAQFTACWRCGAPCP